MSDRVTDRVTNKQSKQKYKQKHKQSGKQSRQLRQMLGLGLIGSGVMVAGYYANKYINDEDELVELVEPVKPVKPVKPVETTEQIYTEKSIKELTDQELYDKEVAAVKEVNEANEAARIKLEETKKNIKLSIEYGNYNLKWFESEDIFNKLRINQPNTTVIESRLLPIFIQLLSYYTCITSTKSGSKYEPISDERLLHEINNSYKEEMLHKCNCDLFTIINGDRSDKVTKNAMAVSISTFMSRKYTPDIELINMYNYLKHNDKNCDIKLDNVVNNLGFVQHEIIKYISSSVETYKEPVVYIVCFLKFLEYARKRRFENVDKYMNVNNEYKKIFMRPMFVHFIIKKAGQPAQNLYIDSDTFKIGYNIKGKNMSEYEYNIILLSFNEQNKPSITLHAL